MRTRFLLLVIVIIVGSSEESFTQPQRDDVCATEHLINNISLIVQNNGKFGASYYDYTGDYGFLDCLTNQRM